MKSNYLWQTCWNVSQQKFACNPYFEIADRLIPSKQKNPHNPNPTNRDGLWMF